MGEPFKIAIIGSGPGGLSAAARAARSGLSHVLLERTDHVSDTIYKYQKGKFVMATPDILPLRAEIPFSAGKRETILAAWNKEIAALGVNLRTNAEVTAIKKDGERFLIKLAGGEVVEALNVILAIGLQGNLNKMRCEGAELPLVQYQLDDPDAFEAETIVVIGAGDAAIENAVALARRNTVVIVNRRDEFARAKQGNLTAITGAIEKDEIHCYYNSAPLKIEPDALILETAEGQARVACDRIIARLGASAPRKFVESCGVVFPSEDPSALPEVSNKYESNVPGLYIIGALGGYPLIKQAMNQGYEVVE
ncbi:MAG: FAD-binding protein, partial [Rhodospirillaceae bacterium]